ncbi:MAG: hypothetical protein WCH58_03220 [Candidatus Saccharibacteria bacterium]
MTEKANISNTNKGKQFGKLYLALAIITLGSFMWYIVTTMAPRPLASGEYNPFYGPTDYKFPYYIITILVIIAGFVYLGKFLDYQIKMKKMKLSAVILAICIIVPLCVFAYVKLSIGR